MSKRLKIIILVLFPLVSMVGITFFALSLGSQEGRVSLDRKITLPKDFSFGKESVALVYFGYIGCSYVCLPAMSELQTWLKDLQLEQKDELAGYFISLQPEVDEANVDAYAKSFHPLLQGRHVAIQTLNALQKEFKFTWAKSPVDPYEINHTGFLYVLKKESGSWILKSIYITRPFNTKLLDEEVKSYIRS